MLDSKGLTRNSAGMTVSYCIRSLFYVDTNTADTIHLSSLEIFNFVITQVPRCFVVESIKLDAVVMSQSANIAAYSAEHCTGVDGSTFGPVRSRFSAPASTGT